PPPLVDGQTRDGERMAQASAVSGTPRPNPSPRSGVSSNSVDLRLLGGFELVIRGMAMAVPHMAQRTLAFVALQGRQLRRSFVAGALWPNVEDNHANGNLRTSLWMLGSERSLVSSMPPAHIGIPCAAAQNWLP